MARVLHHVDTWLPLSAQFVHGHVSRSRHRSFVTSREPLAHLDAFPHRPVVSLPALVSTPGPAQGLRRTAFLAGLALAWRVDLVHVHFGYALHDVVGTHRRLRLPLSVALHGDDVTALVRERPDHYRSVADDLALVVVPSEWLGERAVDAGIPAEVVVVVPSGVDTERFVPTPLPDGPPTAAFVGRFVPKKGLDVLVEAWPRVRAAVPDARLRVLGDGPHAFLVDDRWDDGIEWVRPDVANPAAQVAAHLAAAHVVVTPSHTAPDGDAESLLLVNLEAQASGRPVVTTRHGGIPEFVDEDTSALVVPELDPAALADAVVALLTDPDRAAAMGAAGPAVAARFDVSVCTERLDTLHDALA